MESLNFRKNSIKKIKIIIYKNINENKSNKNIIKINKLKKENL